MAAYGTAYYPNQTGAVTTYAVPFEYLSADDITVEVAGSPVAFTFISSGVVSVSPAPVGDVYIYRTTDIAEAVTEFKNGAGLLASDLNSQVDQLLFAVQEASDAASVSIRIPEGERGVVSTLLPSVDDRATRTLVFDEDGNVTVSDDSYVDNAVKAAQSASDAADALLLADAARVLSEAARDAAGDYANDAEGFALSAGGYATASAASASSAQAIVDSIGQESVEVVVNNRTLVLADNGKIFAVDASSGSVVVTLPTIASVGEPYRVTVKKTDNTANTVSVAPSSSDTVNGSTSALNLRNTGDGRKFFADLDTSPDNWVTQEFGIAVGDATPVGSEMWFAGTTPPPGWLVENGALLSRSVFPDLWAHASSSGMLVTEANWQSTTENRAKFSSGDGSTTFRLPDLTTDGLFIRAQTANAPDFGRREEDAFQRHCVGAGPGGNRAVQALSHAGAGTAGSGGLYSQNLTPSGTLVVPQPTDDGVAIRTAEETRPKNAGRLPIIKAFSVPVDSKSIDVAALVTQVTDLQTQLAGTRKKLLTVNNSLVLPLPAGYSRFAISASDLLVSTTADLYLQVSTDGGATWKTTGYKFNRAGVTTAGGAWGAASSSSSGACILLGGVGVFGSAYPTMLDLTITLPAGGGLLYFMTITGTDAAGQNVYGVGSGGWGSTTAVNAVRLVPSTGTLTGTAVLYGDPA